MYVYLQAVPRKWFELADCNRIPLGGDFKNKQTPKQLFEQEYYCSNNCLSLKTIIISIKLFHQEYDCFIIIMIV